MNTDLPPISAFFLESPATAWRPIGKGHTLTMRLDLTPVHPAFGAMSGNVCVDETACAWAPRLRAAVVPADGPVLTITF
jgi:hypothetical protein